jgi:hypothetical protein
MKMYGGAEIQLHAFLTSALDGSEWSASRIGRFTPGKEAPGTQWLGGWVGPRAGLDAVTKRRNPYPRRPRLRVSLKMEAARSSEMLVSYHITTQCYDTADLDLNLHRREELNSRVQDCITSNSEQKRADRSLRLGSRVRIPPEAWTCVRVFLCCVVLCR